ncbi:hypothetical protein [Prochlorococcus sp. MIT 1303]|uniref:hypothetical protein n=1 Tax=Prochlorococcus sp. MIT 1303 TaxID=1723647 RepID=UPI0007B3974C|nr:hypothetical protein [Prochlorococcus sp. MIT 1303]
MHKLLEANDQRSHMDLMTPTNFLDTQQAAELLSVFGCWLRQRKAKRIFKPGTYDVYSTGNMQGDVIP